MSFVGGDGSMIYVTGDTHGDTDTLMNGRHIPDGRKLCRDDKMIVCGDFGFVMHADKFEGRYSDEWKLDRLEKEYPCELLFVSGNHENFNRLETCPAEERYGGSVRRIRKNIFLLRRGEVYNIEGKSFFTFGGAYSTDRAFRKENESWWPKELPSPREYSNAVNNLKKYKNSFDYIITHTCPYRLIPMMGKYCDPHEAELSGFLDWIFTDVKFSRWFFGHWHTDREFYGGKIIGCYETVYKINDK